MARYLTLALAASLALTGCGDDDGGGASAAGSGWQIGPVIDGKNYSVGLPVTPDRHPEGFAFDIGPGQQPHYVTKRSPALAGKAAVRMRYRAEAAPDTVIHGAGCPAASPSKVTIYLQRDGDNWRTEGYRWWATFASQRLGGPGEFEIVAPLSGRWTGSVSANSIDHKPLFDKALAETDRVGFTFANCEGYGHGAAATAPVRFVVTEFSVE